MAADSDDMSFEPPLSTTFNTAENIPATRDSNFNTEKNNSKIKTINLEIFQLNFKNNDDSLKAEEKLQRIIKQDTIAPDPNLGRNPGHCAF